MAEIRPGFKVSSKPFKSSHDEQIKLVSSFGWLDFSALQGIDEEYAELLKGSVFIDEQRRDKLCYALQTRVKLLKEAALQMI
jgi:hypothetical protein